MIPHSIFRNTVPLTSSGVVENKNFSLCILHFFCVFLEYVESIEAYMKNMTKLGLFAVHKISPNTQKILAHMEKSPKRILPYSPNTPRDKKNGAYLGEFVLTKPKIF